MNNNKIVNKTVNYFTLFKEFIIKPSEAILDNLNIYSTLKHSIIITSIVSLLTSIILVIKAIIDAIYVPAYSGFMGFGGTESTWIFSNIKNVSFIPIFFKSFVSIFIIIGVIAGVYYLVNMITKNSVKFERILTMASLSYLPFLILSLIISPIVSIFIFELGYIIGIFGIIYSGTIFINAINNELNFKSNDLKVLLNTTAISTILVILSYLVYRNLGDILNNNIMGMIN